MTQAARKHRVGSARIRRVIDTTTAHPTVTKRGEAAWLWIGTDERGVELEVIAVELADGALLVTHAMPRHYRERT